MVYFKTCSAHMFLKFRVSIPPFSSLISLEWFFCMGLGRDIIRFTFHLFKETPRCPLFWPVTIYIASISVGELLFLQNVIIYCL